MFQLFGFYFKGVHRYSYILKECLSRTFTKSLGSLSRAGACKEAHFAVQGSEP